MPLLTTPSHQIFYTHNRTTSPVHLLLIHGAADTHLGWPAELRRMAGVSVYTLDLPGHGRSPLPHCPTIAGYATAVAELITTLGLTHVILVGHSMGGAIAQQLAAEQPTWLAGLVLVATAAHMPVNPALIAQSLQNLPATADIILKYSWSREADDALKANALAALLATPPQVVHDDFVACNAFDGSPLLGRIAVPTLIVGGEKDRMTAVAESERLQQAIPHAQLAILPQASHRLTLERAPELAALIRQFMGQWV